MSNKLPFDKKNYLLFGLGLLLLVVGYYLMGIGPHNSFASLTLSPIILILTYTVIFPASILMRFKKVEKNTEKS